MPAVATDFTIAIPTHDRRDTVLLAARSALAQTRSADQVIVLCDGCTDGTPEALRALGDERLEVLDLPKLPGYAYAHRNVALEQARGEAMLWLGDDDLLLPDHLERLGEVWDAGEADLVSSPAVLVHPDDALEWFGADWGVPRFRSAMETANSNVMASVSVRAALVREVGGWDAAQPRLGRLGAVAPLSRCGSPRLDHGRAHRAALPRDRPGAGVAGPCAAEHRVVGPRERSRGAARPAPDPAPCPRRA